MATITWPDALKARRWDAHLRNSRSSGGRSATGREQAVYSDAGFWEVSIGGIRISERVEAASYRAMIARLRAGDDILLPLCDLYQAVGSRLSTAAATLSADAHLRSMALSLTVTGVDIQPGHHLTIGDRLHIVTEVTSGPESPPLLNQVASDSPWSDALPWSDATAASSAYGIKILPPLRADYASGDPVSFRNLLVRCVLKDPTSGDLELDLGRFGAPSLTFIELI